MAHEATFSKLESQVRSYCRETPTLFATARGAEIWDATGTRFMTRFPDVRLKPRNLPYVMHFTGPTGANSVEAAIKLARKCTGRYAVAAFTNAFHGVSMR